MFTIYVYTMDQEVNWLWKLFNSLKFNVITRKLPTNLISSGKQKLSVNMYQENMNEWMIDKSQWCISYAMVYNLDLVNICSTFH